MMKSKKKNGFLISHSPDINQVSSKLMQTEYSICLRVKWVTRLNLRGKYLTWFSVVLSQQIKYILNFLFKPFQMDNSILPWEKLNRHGGDAKSDAAQNPSDFCLSNSIVYEQVLHRFHSGTLLIDLYLFLLARWAGHGYKQQRRKEESSLYCLWSKSFGIQFRSNHLWKL